MDPLFVAMLGMTLDMKTDHKIFLIVGNEENID
jgi:hypothetical protein